MVRKLKGERSRDGINGIQDPQSHSRGDAGGPPTAEHRDAIRVSQALKDCIRPRAYALIILDEQEMTRTFTSDAVHQSPTNIFDPQESKNFCRTTLKLLDSDAGLQSHHLNLSQSTGDDLGFSQPRRLSSNLPPEQRMPMRGSQSNGYSPWYDSKDSGRPLAARTWQHSPSGESESAPEGDDDSSVGYINQPPPQVEMMIGDGNKIKEYYRTRLHAIQQLPLKVICKAWIKVVEPRKQSKYPYKGRAETKPPWWPDEAEHIEPDHLNYTARMALAKTILRKAIEPSDPLKLSDLQKATVEVGSQIDESKRLILAEVYRIATKESQYLDGDFDASTIVYVCELEKKSLKSKTGNRRKRELSDGSETPSKNQRRGLDQGLANTSMQQSRAHSQISSPSVICSPTDRPAFGGSVRHTSLIDHRVQDSTIPPPNRYSHFSEIRSSVTGPNGYEPTTYHPTQQSPISPPPPLGQSSLTSPGYDWHQPRMMAPHRSQTYNGELMSTNYEANASSIPTSSASTQSSWPSSPYASGFSSFQNFNSAPAPHLSHQQSTYHSQLPPPTLQSLQQGLQTLPNPSIVRNGHSHHPNDAAGHLSSFRTGSQHHHNSVPDRGSFGTDYSIHVGMSESLGNCEND